MKANIDAEAEARGVTPAALMRAGLNQFLQDLDQRRLGYVGPRVVVIQLVRAQVIEIHIPRQERGDAD